MPDPTPLLVSGTSTFRLTINGVGLGEKVRNDTLNRFIAELLSNTLWLKDNLGTGAGDMLKSVYDTDNDGKVNSALNADVAPWAGITGKPATFAPSAHTHLKAEITDFAHTHAIADLPVATSGVSSATQLVRADDSRLSDARAPTAHVHAQSDVTNLTTDLAAKAPLASPALTGTPTAPTATAGTNTTQLATTGFVTAGLAGKANTAHTHGVADLTATGTRDGTTVLRGDNSWRAPTYDVASAVAGKPAANEKCLLFRAPRPLTLRTTPLNGGSHQFASDVAATASTTFTAYKNGVSIGTIVFAPAATTGTLTLTATPVGFVAGDRLRVDAPATADATLADLYLTLALEEA